MTQRKRTALIVANNREEAQLLVGAFTKAGHNGILHALADTTEAKRYLRGEGPFADRTKYPFPSLVILDDANGWGLMEWMRKEPDFMTVHAMILSRLRDLPNETRARELGAAFESHPQSAAEYAALAARIAEFWLLG